jgi:hypothetical protein
LETDVGTERFFVPGLMNFIAGGKLHALVGSPHIRANRMEFEEQLLSTSFTQELHWKFRKVIFFGENPTLAGFCR